MPMEWRLSEVIPIYKNKGDAQTCSNYRGIKLLSHTMKLWERVIENRLRRETKVSENQFGFMPGCSSMEGAKTRVRTTVGYTEYFPVEVGLHQGSALSPFLFALVLDDLSQRIQGSIPWCLIFADDIVVVSESQDELNRRLEQWRNALEQNGLRISRLKSEYLRCDYGRIEDHNDTVDIRIGDQKSIISK
ncbi:uncharacterized protein [Rutidosis leptorrhynchoides]|uniref:uncharacterized protein n=1 Tax=Rutidosis leptorrhynchoides TaxID=125765 RepID=UPI003A993466